MKKLILLPLMFLVTIIYAQPGIKAGVNISNFTGGDFGDIDNKGYTSYHAGGLWRFNLGKLALQPELVFSSQGAKLEKNGDEQTYEIKYFNVPIMIQYHTGGGLFLQAGPQIAFKLSEDVPDDANIDDFAKSNDFAVCLGLGYQMKGGLGIDARYNVGVSKVGEDDSPDYDSDFKMGVFQIGLFFTFFTKKE
jgi:hypothetical protein